MAEARRRRCVEVEAEPSVAPHRDHAGVVERDAVLGAVEHRHPVVRGRHQVTRLVDEHDGSRVHVEERDALV